MAQFSVSQSKVKTYRRCRMAYHLKYVEKIRPKRIKRPFQFGRIIHSMIEAHAEGKDPFEILDEIELKNEKLFAEEKEMYGEIIEDIAIIMEEYFEYWPDRELKPIKKGDRYSEHRFEIDLGDGLVFKGVIDMLAKTINGLRWLTEHKTFSSYPSEDHEWRNLQSVVYIKAIELLGWGKYDGTLWNYIRSRPPSTPKILQSGALSKAKCDTLPNKLREVLAENKIPIADAQKQLKEAVDNRRNYFFRRHTPVHPTVVDKVFAGFIDTANEMRKNHGCKWDQNIDRHCGWCDYEPICRAELTGGDVAYIKETQFKAEEEEDRFKDNPVIHKIRRGKGPLKSPRKKARKKKA